MSLWVHVYVVYICVCVFLGIAGEIRVNSKVMFFYGLLYMDTPVLADRKSLHLSAFLWVFMWERECLYVCMSEWEGACKVHICTYMCMSERERERERERVCMCTHVCACQRGGERGCMCNMTDGCCRWERARKRIGCRQSVKMSRTLRVPAEWSTGFGRDFNIITHELSRVSR